MALMELGSFNKMELTSNNVFKALKAIAFYFWVAGKTAKLFIQNKVWNSFEPKVLCWFKTKTFYSVHVQIWFRKNILFNLNESIQSQNVLSHPINPILLPNNIFTTKIRNVSVDFGTQCYFDISEGALFSCGNYLLVKRPYPMVSNHHRQNTLLHIHQHHDLSIAVQTLWEEGQIILSISILSELKYVCMNFGLNELTVLINSLK